MSQPTATRTVTVANRDGLHARSALAVLGCVREFRAKVELVRDSERADAGDIWQTLALGAGQGVVLRLEATGPDAEEAVDAVARLFAARFHEEDN